MNTTLIKPSAFYRDMFRLALPIVFQNLITTAVGSADVIMLGLVSQSALSAGSLASQIMFILNLVYSGISSGIGMLAAQYWGKKDTRTIEKIMGIGMKISILSLLRTCLLLPKAFDADLYIRGNIDPHRYSLSAHCRNLLPFYERLTGISVHHAFH